MNFRFVQSFDGFSTYNIMNLSNEVFLIGCGKSIGFLSQEEIDHINRAAARIALNKFTAFAADCGINPTHVYFVDHQDDVSRLWIQHTFDVCRKERRQGLTFIIHRNLQWRLETSRVRHGLKRAKYFFEGLKDRTVYLGVPGCDYDFITHAGWREGGNWAQSLDEPLFHYRGSLSTALNYIAIRFPGSVIKMVGCDFTSDGYFFDDKMKQGSIPWQDWTTPMVQQGGRHFSAISYEGTTLFDKLPLIINCLRETGNTVYCCNENSLLVTEGRISALGVTTPGDHPEFSLQSH